MRRLFTTLLALFLLVAVVADANARNRRRSSGTVYYSTPYVVAQDGTAFYSSRYYMPDSTVYIERPASGELRVYDDTIVFGPSSPGVYRSFYYEPGPGDGVYYSNTRRGRGRR